VTYFVNASLFIYLVHHPLTLFFGAYITPHIASNTLGFFTGLVFVLAWRSCSTKSICGSLCCASCFQANRRRKPDHNAAHFAPRCFTYQFLSRAPRRCDRAGSFLHQTDKEHLLWHRFERQVSVNGFNAMAAAALDSHIHRC
jgi:hypothetical protein